MTPGGADQFDKPWLLLCEGLGDQRFFERLFEARNIGQNFSLRYPHREGKWDGGRGSFGKDLGAISVNEFFIAKVRAILVVSDNDTATSFAEVQAQIRKAPTLPVPDTERTVARRAGAPDIVVLMLPIGELGNLETLCLRAAHAKWGLETELNAFARATPANGWLLGKQSKMKMQTMLAATNSEQPDCGFTGHWNQKAEFRVPVDHSTFDSVCDFIRDFPALLGA